MIEAVMDSANETMEQNIKYIKTTTLSNEELISTNAQLTKGIDSAIESHKQYQKSLEDTTQTLFTAEESKSMANSMASGIINYLRGGETAKSLGQVFKETLQNVFLQRAQAALVTAFDTLFSSITMPSAGGGKGGGIAGFFSSLFMSKGGMVPQYLSTGGVAGGPKGSDTIPAWLTPGEVILNAAQQKNVANAMGNSQGNNVTINITGNVDQRAINQIKQVIASDPTMIHQLNENGKRAGTGLRRK